MNERSILDGLGLPDEFGMIWEKTLKVIERKGYVLKRPPGARTAMLGEGAFSAVYYAEHAQDKTPVAIKIFRDEDETILASFRREVTMLRALEFPKQCAVVVYDSWHEPGAQPLIVMEYVRGLPIHEHCAQRRLSRAVRLRLLEDAFRALQGLHDKNIQHRDVSVANIVIDPLECPRFLDFGLSAEIQRTTLRSTIAGRGAYGPGEVKYGNKRADPKDDIFAGGMVAIHVLTDQVPPENTTSSGDPKHLEACRSQLKKCGIDRALTEVLVRAVQAPELRYSKPLELAEAIFDYRVLAPARLKMRRVVVASVWLFPCFGFGGWWLYAKTQQERLAADYAELKVEADKLPNRDREPVSRLIDLAEGKREEWETLYTQRSFDAAYAALDEGVSALRRAIVVDPMVVDLDYFRNKLQDDTWADYQPVALRKQRIEERCPQVEGLLSQGDWGAINNARQSIVNLQEQLRELRKVNGIAMDRAAFEKQFAEEIPEVLSDHPQVAKIVETQRSADKYFDVAQSDTEWENTQTLYGQAKQKLDDFVRPTNEIGMALRLIKPGSFEMGTFKKDSTKEERAAFAAELHIDATCVEWEWPQHTVTITRPFWLGVHEVTVGQFQQFVDATGYVTEAEKDDAGARVLDGSDRKLEKGRNWRKPGFPQDDRHPVVYVSDKDAEEFCKWLSEKTGQPYDLPTEAQWEFACRAGTKTRFPFGDDVQNLPKYANVADATLKEKLGWDGKINGYDGHVYTAPVGSFEPNAWGLHDMLGNVWEWTKDWWRDYDADASALEDPTGSNDQEKQKFWVRRGGGWIDGGVFCRPADRGRSTPGGRFNFLGFRVARGLSSE